MLAPFKKLDSLARSVVLGGARVLERHFESASSVHPNLLIMALGGFVGMPMLYEMLIGRDNTLFYWCLMAGCYLALSVAGCYVAWGYNRQLNLKSRRAKRKDFVAVAPRGRGEMLAPFKTLDSLARSLVLSGVRMLERHFESASSVHPMLSGMALGGCLGMAMLYKKLGGRENTLYYGYLMFVACYYIVYAYKRWSNLKSRHAQVGALSINMTRTSPLVSLPDMIFSNILEYLDWGDVGRLDTAFLSRSTRDSYLFALQLRKVKVVRSDFWRKAVNRGILSWLISRNIRVISWDLKVDNAQLISIANGFPQLQSVNIRSNNMITEEELRALVMRDIDISYQRDITDEGITALANGLPQLQSLDISNCDKITDDGITALANGCPQLQSLNIIECRNITDEGITALARGLPQLQSLNICCCDKITDEGIRTLASGLLPRLQSLNIGRCNTTDEGLIVLARGLPQLQSLNIGGSYNITDEGIRALASELLPQLQSLDISDCGNITDEGIRALASGCPQLQSVNIGCCRDITDEGVTALAKGLHQLQSLDIGGCRDITDEVIGALAIELPQLQSLNISSCEITDEGARALASGCHQLLSLDINGCRNITDEGITALASGLPQLQFLDIGYCDNITDEGIIAMADGLPQLQSLNIDDCHNITDEGLIALARGCPQLQSLTGIDNCDGITYAGEKIAKKINSRR